METDKPEKLLLTGKSNFLGWIKIMSSRLRRQKLLVKADEDSGYTFVPEKDVEAYDEIISRISLKIAESVPAAIDPSILWEYLSESYGVGNKFDLMDEFQELSMTRNLDPAGFIEMLDVKKNKIEIAGGTVTTQDEYRVLLKGMHQVFYSDFIRKTRTAHEGAEVTAKNIVEIKQDLKAFYKNTPEAVRNQFKLDKKVFKTSSQKGKKWEERNCDYCAENHPKIAKTHHEDDCKAKARDAVAKSDEESNKQSETYLDTASAISLSERKPSRLDCSKKSKIVGVTGDSTNTCGTGDMQLLDLEVPETGFIPDLGFGIISGSQIVKQGKKIVLELDPNKHEDVKIFDGHQVVATGTLKNDMFVMNGDFIPSKKTFKSRSSPSSKEIKLKNCFALLSMEDHIRFGHLGSPQESCSQCALNKQRKRTIPKTSFSPATVVLEKVSVDLQGPFPIKAIDGTNMNIKIVDDYSGYIKMETIHDKEAATTKDVTERFISRSERQTGRKVKFVQTDGGNEFNGSFLGYLESLGIIKRKGAPYDHHFPPHAENANLLISRMSKPTLAYSKLPLRFYAESMLYCTYVLNRYGKVSRFEKFFGRKPKIQHIQPFGSICYAFIPAEKRTKLDPVRERCRLIGFGDDDDTEEVAGYKLLVESDNSIVYCNDVVFKGEAIVELQDELGPSYLGHDIFDTDYATFSDIDSEASGETLASGSNNIVRTRRNSRREARRWNPEEFGLTETISDDVSQGLTNDSQNSDDDGDYVTGIEDLSTAESVSDDDFVLLAKCFKTFRQDSRIPNNLQDVLKSAERKQWENAMAEEEASMVENGVYDIVHDKLPAGVNRAISSRWVFAKQIDSSGDFSKFKARLVAKGFMEKYGIDYEEVFAPVAKFKSIRLLLAVAAKRGWKLYQDDVKTAFLNALLEAGKWLRLPNGKFVFIVKALYGLKESPREWFKLFRQFMIETGFIQSVADHCIFIKSDIIVSVYVDDILTTGNDKEIHLFREQLKARFRLNEKGGLAHLYLGLSINQTIEDEITIDQIAYVKDKLVEFQDHIGPHKCMASPLASDFQQILIEAEKSEEFEPKFPYREMVGSLVYAMMGTRFDIAAAVSIVSKYCSKPKKAHCEMVRRIYWYLRGNCDLRLVYSKNGTTVLKGYCDSSYANLENYASLCGYVFTFNGTAVSWSSHRESVITTSTSEAEYVALLPCLQDCVWHKLLLSEFGYPQDTIEIMEDNEACILLAKNPQNHKKTRHIQVRYHWSRQAIADGVAKLSPIKTKDQLADIFTKGVYGPALRNSCTALGLERIAKSAGELRVVKGQEITQPVPCDRNGK
jgi:hypothetical protein